MKLSDARKESNELTGLFSAAVRSLLFAGVAIVWLFASDGPAQPSQVELGSLRWPLLAFLLGLLFDVAQYAVQAFWYRHVYVRQNAAYEAAHQADPTVDMADSAYDVRAPKGMARAADTLFKLKGVAAVIGYLTLAALVLTDLL